MPMLSRHLPFARITWILRVFVATGLLSMALGPGCSEGESGLVLGRPQRAEAQGGEGPGGTLAGSGGADPFAGGGGAGGANEGWIVEACTPLVGFENRDAAGKGQLFTQAVADPVELIRSVAHDACRTLYRNAAEVKPVESIQLVVDDFAGVATTSGSSMRLSSNHLQVTSDRGADVAREIAGVLHFTVANVYQHDGEGTAPTWLITGVADFVRLDAQLIDSGARVKGGNYDDGSKTTAFFFDFLRTRNPDVVYLLNQRLAPAASPWSDDAFIDVMGADVATLWASYQQTL